MALDLPAKERFQFSEHVCKCGWHHKLGDITPSRPPLRTYMRTLVDSEPVNSDGDVVPAGSVGWVREWTQYGGPVSVRVQFEDLRDRYQWALRASYNPCELEHT